MSDGKIRIEEYYDGFSVDVFGKSYSWDHNDETHEVLVDIIKEILYHTSSDAEVEYEAVC